MLGPFLSFCLLIYKTYQFYLKPWYLVIKNQKKIMQSPVDICDKALKTLIVGYFCKFSPDHCKVTCAEMKCSIYRIPEIYYKYGGLIQQLRECGENCMADVLWNIPEKSSTVEFKHIPAKQIKHMFEYRQRVLQSDAPEEIITETLPLDRYVWNIGLIAVDDKTASFDLSGTFGAESTKIKDMINNILASSLGVFAHYKYKYPELMETLELYHDTENMTIHLRDGRFPEYQHNTCVTYSMC
jgi:hypothetical protein